MQSINELLPKNLPQEPKHFQKIKHFVKNRFGFDCSVRQTQNGLIISVPNGTAATELRISHLELFKECQIPPETRLVVQINSEIN